MRISTSTLWALSKHYAPSYPYSVNRIFQEANELAKEKGYKFIIQLEVPLAQRLDSLVMLGQ